MLVYYLMKKEQNVLLFFSILFKKNVVKYHRSVLPMGGTLRKWLI